MRNAIIWLAVTLALVTIVYAACFVVYDTNTRNYMKAANSMFVTMRQAIDQLYKENVDLQVRLTYLETRRVTE